MSPINESVLKQLERTDHELSDEWEILKKLLMVKTDDDKFT